MELNIENLMKTAIQEMENGQHTEASKHFDMVVINDASNIDAPFFRAYCKCRGDIKLGEMPNVAIAFEKAFCYYVDVVKALNNAEIEKEKLDYAVKLLTKVISEYRYNAKRNPGSIGMGIRAAATNMNNTCIAKLTEVGANVSNDVLERNEIEAKATKNISCAVSPGLLIGIIIVLAPLLYLIGTWIGGALA